MLFIIILNITIITDAGLGYVYLAFVVFGFPFIALSYAIGYIFKNPETGYKFAIIFGLITYAVPLILSSFVPSTAKPFEAIIPWISFNNSLTLIIAPTAEEKAAGGVMSRIGLLMIY